MPDGVIGSFIDHRYKVVSRLGSGGMADVYLAEDEQLGRKIALKLLHRRFAEDPGFVERFRREAQAAAGLQHPNVVGVYDRGGYDGTYYIAMEYVPGRTLKQLIRDQAPLDPIRAIDITIQVLRAARFAHRHGVIHRDLKPQNVMVDESDQAKVTDFGIARAGASDMTETGSILGTAQYLSPEQAQGHAVSASSDLYSIAVMLYEMLTGRVPFEGEQAVTIAIKHVSEAPTAPTTVNPSLPVDLEQVVMWALNKNPADRPADADQFISALEHAKAVIVSGEAGQRTASIAAVGAGGGAGGVVLAAGVAHEAGAAVVPGEEEAAAVDGAGQPPEDQEPARKRRGRNWLWALVAAIVLAGAGYGAYLLTRPAQAVVPPVVGEQFDVAKTQLLNTGFQVHELSTTSNHPPGYVFAENPTGGVKADKGSTVTLTVSTGPGNTSVPAVEGQPLNAAQRAIQQAHLKVGQVQQQSSSQVTSGDVISTSPTAGQTVPVNTSVEIFVSSGRPLVKVPGVVGQSQDSARSALQAAGFQVTTSTQSSSSVQAGNVISQDPSGGTEATSGSTVSLVISTAPVKTTPTTATVPVPSVTGDKPGQATSALRGAGFKVNQTTKNVTNQSKDGVVVSQSPSGSATKGSTVTIVVGQLQQSGGGGPTNTTPTTTTQ
jgi:eukaryotic-like serine/threonine-protein kinase